MLDECQKGQLKESATSQGDIAVVTFEDKNKVICCPSTIPTHSMIHNGNSFGEGCPACCPPHLPPNLREFVNKEE